MPELGREVVQRNGTGAARAGCLRICGHFGSLQVPVPACSGCVRASLDGVFTRDFAATNLADDNSEHYHDWSIYTLYWHLTLPDK